MLLHKHFFLLSIAVCLAAYAQAAEPLLQQSNLVHLGSFKVPTCNAGGTAQACFEYGGAGLAFNPSKNSLYMIGHTWDQFTGEISIPALGGTAALLQTPTDALEGKLPTINPSDTNSKQLGGQMVYNNQLYIAAWSYYDGAVTQTKSQFLRPLNLSTKTQVQGPFTVGSKYPGWVDHYVTQIPSEWQAALGGPALTGGCCASITSAQSQGPTASVFNPADVGVKNPVPATVLVGYDFSTHETLGSWGGNGVPNPLYNMATTVGGLVFPAGSSSVLFFGKTGLGKGCYGPGTGDQNLVGTIGAGFIEPYCYDPDNASKGTHAYPYTAFVWAYDANDLAAVKNGTKSYWTVVPYATFQLSDMGSSAVGAAYDPATQKIYVSQFCATSTCAPLVHVYQISGLGGITPPPPPATSACDLNGDTNTNVTDVQLVVNQAIGVSSCTGDLNKDGTCNVIDVQRVVNAALGGTCVTQ